MVNPSWTGSLRPIVERRELTVNRISIISSTTFALLMIVPTRLYAASPPVAPADHTEYSPNHHFFLISSVKEKRTRIFGASDPAAVLWEIPLYLQNADLANDGLHVAASYDGGNIFDEKIRPSDTLITFYSATGRKRVVTVGEVVPDLISLPRSSEGRPWGRVVGFQASGDLLILLNNGRAITLAPESTASH